MSDFTATGYRDAAVAHAAVARDLYGLAHYGASLFWSGLAIECLLRGYRLRIDPEFDARHDLNLLFDDCGIVKHVSAGQELAIRGHLVAVARRWSSNFRFRSPADVGRHLKRLRMDRGIRGDIVKENARVALAAARQFVEIGVASWPR